MAMRKEKLIQKVNESLLASQGLDAAAYEATSKITIQMISDVIDIEKKKDKDRHFASKKIRDAKEDAEALNNLGKRPSPVAEIAPSKFKKGYIDENETIRVSEELNLTAHGLSLQEERLILLTASKITKSNTLRAPDNEDGTPGRWIPPELTVTAQEFAKTFNVNIRDALTYLREADKNLRTRQIKTFIHDKKYGDGLREANWVQETTKFKNAGVIKIMFTSAVIDHLLDLNNKYLLFGITRIGQVKSLYALRLFMLLEQHKDTAYKLLTIKVDAFNHAMGVTSKTALNNFANCKQSVIEPAIAELISLNLFHKIEFEAVKFGKKYTDLKISINRPLKKPDAVVKHVQ